MTADVLVAAGRQLLHCPADERERVTPAREVDDRHQFVERALYLGAHA